MKIAMLVPDNRDEFRRASDPAPYFGPAPTALLEGLAQMPDCEVHIVCCMRAPHRAPAKLAENIHYHSVLVPAWGWLRGAYIGCVLALRKKLREINPDIVHGQGTERYCALAAVCSGFPNVVTIHGNMRQLAKTSQARPISYPWLAAQFERFTLPRTQGVICNSRHTQQLAGELAGRTWLVPNALRGSFFLTNPVAPASIPPILLNIGFVTPNKSQDEVLEMAGRLRRRNARFEIHFVGKLMENTAYSHRFLKRIKAAEKEGYARFLGEKPELELIALMDSAAGLIHAPKEEAFGLVVAEALARNLKFFGMEVGGVPGIAKGVDGAELFKPTDIAGMEEAIMRWLETGHQKPTRAAEQMKERYSPDVIARQHIRIYQQIMNAE